MALASMVLPVPGGLDEQHALGQRAAEALVFFRITQEIHNFRNFAFSLTSMPATSLNRIVGRSFTRAFFARPRC